MIAGRITLREIAIHAGVSPKTVSRVLGGAKGGFSAATQQRVRALAAQLGYEPNPFAQGLARARSRFIALLSDNRNASYVMEVQLGASQRCAKSGCHLLIEPVNPGESPIAVVADLLRASNPLGVVIAPPLCQDSALLDFLDERGVRYVRISPADARARAAAVRCDDRSAAYGAVQFLSSLGHRRVAFVTGPEDGPAAAQRLAGYRDAVRDAGLARDAELVAQGDFTFSAGVAAAERLLKTSAPPTAIFAANDVMAAGVIAAAARSDISVPHRLAVVGFDDSAAARLVWPQLTTVHQPIREMADAAADILIRHEELDPGLDRWFEPKLVVRATTGPAPPQWG